jgi:hypothetical protein
MSTPYVRERQAEYWTSRQAEDYFVDYGFELLVLPIPPSTELLLPTDYIFFDKQQTKLFGLQYKALYRNGMDHWQLKDYQHLTLRLYPWIYYCLLELREVNEFRMALHLARIAETGFPFKPQIYSDGKDRFHDYMRWATFFRRLKQCEKGALVVSESHLRTLITAGSDDAQLSRISDEAADLFLADFSSKHAIHFSPFLARTG